MHFEGEFEEQVGSQVFELVRGLPRVIVEWLPEERFVVAEELAMGFAIVVGAVVIAIVAKWVAN